MIKVLFVCLGNICRSPMAEGIFIDIINSNNLGCKFFVDSAGTAGYHAGELADPRMRETAIYHGIKLESRSRKLNAKDLEEFDYVVAMDRSNFDDIQSLKTNGACRAKILLMRDFDTDQDSLDVPDPYYGGQEGFENVYNILLRSNNNFLEYLKTEHNIE